MLWELEHAAGHGEWTTFRTASSPLGDHRAFAFSADLDGVMPCFDTATGAPGNVPGCGVFWCRQCARFVGVSAKTLREFRALPHAAKYGDDAVDANDTPISVFHGTTLRAATDIARHGFRVRACTCRSRLSGCTCFMLGPAVYVTPHRDKAVKYTRVLSWDHKPLRGKDVVRDAVGAVVHCGLARGHWLAYAADKKCRCRADMCRTNGAAVSALDHTGDWMTKAEGGAQCLYVSEGFGTPKVCEWAVAEPSRLRVVHVEPVAAWTPPIQTFVDAKPLKKNPGVQV